MKARIDFVTNSSSSSFVIYKSDLTPEQLELLLDEDKLFDLIAKKYPTPCKNKYDRFWFDDPICLKCESYACEAGGWKIEEVGDKIVGSTIIDNFDMIGFLQSIGIPIADYDDSQSGAAGLIWLEEKYGIDLFKLNKIRRKER